MITAISGLHPKLPQLLHPNEYIYGRGYGHLPRLLFDLRDKLKKHQQLQSASTNQADRRWLNGFIAAGFHSGLISLSDLKLEYMKAHRNAYGDRLTEA